MNWVAVFIGGGLGSVLRYFLQLLLKNSFTFPLATLLANLGGAFLLGFLVQLGLGKTNIPVPVQLFFTTGMCGGFSTFSTYTHESILLWQQGNTWMAMVNLIGSVVACLLFYGLGQALGRGWS